MDANSSALVLIVITLFAATVNGAIGYGFFSQEDQTARVDAIGTVSNACDRTLLHPRTRYRAVRAEDAAIPRLRLEAFATTLAVVEETAGVLRHLLARLIAAVGAGDGGLRTHRDVWSTARLCNSKATDAACPNF